MASSRLSPLSLCSVWRCRSSSLASSSLRRLVSSIFSASFALVAFDHPLLAAQALGLLFERVLAFVEQAFALVQLLAELGQFLLALGLGVDGAFFDFEFGLFDAVGAVALGPADDLAGFGLGVPPTQTIEQFDCRRPRARRRRRREWQQRPVDLVSRQSPQLSKLRGNAEPTAALAMQAAEAAEAAAGHEK